MGFLSFAFVTLEFSILPFGVPAIGMMVGWGSTILVPFHGQEGNKDGPACPPARYGCGRERVLLLGSSGGGSWATLSFLSVLPSNEGRGRCSQVVLGCGAVHDGMVALLGGDGALLVVGGCSGSGC